MMCKVKKNSQRTTDCGQQFFYRCKVVYYLIFFSFEIVFIVIR